MMTSTQRFHDFDALRGFAMLLGIVMHGLLSFVVLPIWPAQDLHQNHEVYGFFQHALHGFRMPLFFLISGFFTAMMWHKRGAKGLITHRAKRILLPLIIGTFLIWPPIIGVSIWGGLAKQKRSEIQAGKDRSGAQAPSDIWTAAKMGDTDTLRLVIDRGTDVNKRDALRVSPLQWAAMYDHPEAIALLVQNGAGVNAKDDNGSTALHSAAFFGCTRSAKQLIELGADPRAVNGKGETPLAVSRMGMGVVHFIAGLIGMPIDTEKVSTGKRETAAYLEKLGGASLGGRDEVTQTANKDTISGNQAPKAEGVDSGGQDQDAKNFGAIFLGLTFFPIFHHLWFLYYLLWLVAIFLLAVRLGRRIPLQTPLWMIATPWCFFWLIPVSALPQLYMTQTFGPDTATGLLPWPPKLIYYLIFFGFGANCFGKSEFEEQAGRRWPLMFVLALPALLIGLRLFERQEGSPTARVLLSLCAVTYAWLMIFGMIGFFRQFFGGENKRIRYLSDSSYWLYIAHLPLIIGLQVWVSNWDLPHFPKFLLVCALTFAILMVMYEYLVRYSFIGTMLNGKKVKEP